MKMKSCLTVAALVLATAASRAETPDAAFAGIVNGVAAETKAAATALPLADDGAVVADRTTTVPVDLNAATVKCSVQGYSMPMLKILVPDLAQITVLNHRNVSEGAPCIAAGRCQNGKLGPQDILKSGEGVVRVPVRVVLTKNARLDGEVCRVSLTEKVYATIRGVAFYHERFQEVAERSAADCR